MKGQAALFDIPPAPAIPHRLAVMHHLYGVCEGKRCGKCAHLVRKRWGYQTFLKCEIVDVEEQAQTDWRARWPACGLWRERQEDENGHGEYLLCRREAR